MQADCNLQEMLNDLTLSTDEDGEESHTIAMNNRPAPATPTTPAEWANVFSFCAMQLLHMRS